MSYPRFQLARSFKYVRQNATLTLNGTTWANFPTIGTHVLAAQIGDVIEAAPLFRYGDEAVAAFIDVVTEVSGTPVNSFGTGGAALISTSGDGIRGFVGPSGNGVNVAGFALYTLVAGDISNNTVTIRWRYRTGIASNKTIYGDSSAGIFFTIKNLGPVDPN